MNTPGQCRVSDCSCRVNDPQLPQLQAAGRLLCTLPVTLALPAFGKSTTACCHCPKKRAQRCVYHSELSLVLCGNGVERATTWLLSPKRSLTRQSPWVYLETAGTGNSLAGNLSRAASGGTPQHFPPTLSWQDGISMPGSGSVQEPGL